MTNFNVRIRDVAIFIENFIYSGSNAPQFDAIYIIERAKVDDIRKKDKNIDIICQSFDYSDAQKTIYVIRIENHFNQSILNEKVYALFNRMVTSDTYLSNSINYCKGGYLLRTFVGMQDTFTEKTGNPLRRLIVDPDDGAFYLSQIGANRYLIGVSRFHSAVSSADLAFNEMHDRVVAIIKG